MKLKQIISIYIHLILNFKCLLLVLSQLDERQFYGKLYEIKLFI